MKRLIALPLVLSFASPVAAQTLWQNIESGMTVQQVRTLYPRSQGVQFRDDSTVIREFRVTERCRADVHIHHPAGVVNRVRVRGEGSLGGRCSDTILTGLSARYGEALSRDRREASILAREGTVYVWHRDGVTLRFKRYTSGAFGGGGFGSASWEVEYTTVTEDIAL